MRQTARLSIASRSREKVERAAKTLCERYEVDCKAYVMDAADAQSIRSWTEATLNDFGEVQGLVVNAGGPPPGNFDDFDDAAWARACDLTLMSAVRMVRSCCRRRRAISPAQRWSSTVAKCEP